MLVLLKYVNMGGGDFNPFWDFDVHGRDVIPIDFDFKKIEWDP